MLSPTRTGVRSWLAVESYFTDGPFINPNKFHRFTGLAKLMFNPTPRSELALAVTHYSGGGERIGPAALPGKIYRGVERLVLVAPFVAVDLRGSPGHTDVH